jgi:hypothetical protein
MMASRIFTCGQGWRFRQRKRTGRSILRQSVLLPELRFSGGGAYNGSTLLGSYSQEIAEQRTPTFVPIRSMYTVEMRIRGNKVRVYSGSSYTLRFTATVSGFSGGYAGYRSDNRTVCELMRLGDAWTYEPYERFDVVPAGRHS